MRRQTQRPGDLANYPPRAMRAERAAAYLDMSVSTFMRLVSTGELPQPIRKDGLSMWDRVDLDHAFEAWKAKSAKRRLNPMAAEFGIEEPYDVDHS